ncbi:DUF397 domain-containing protein [Streptomyces sp. NBC_00838]|uniref:DUF397 domain-containing protein n=1 Tax=Streptomyces sp. NBC_00838 TaxID=2903680 RepID=UPI003870A932|nr:DUF397 domain-containing protein [Streptomyces sp. NBC_00838]
MKPHLEAAPAAGPEWVRSSYSGANGNCVEVASLPDGSRLLRDSKRPHSPVIAFRAGLFDTFVRSVTTGGFAAR